jgi:precorrin-6B methylase 2
MNSFLKHALLGHGRKGRRIPFGLYRGLTLSIDPASEMGLWLGLYEAETTSWLRAAGRQARSLVDVGAGYGEMTVWGLSQPVMEKVLAYDSKPERWPVFRENLAHNGLTGDRRLSAVEGMFLGGEDDERSLAALQALPDPVLMKIDVDGGEEAILQKLGQVLSAKRMLVLIETHSEAFYRACRQFVSEGGYNVRSIATAWWRRVVWERRQIGFNQ